MKQGQYITLTLVLLSITSMMGGCIGPETKGDDYEDAPPSIQDGSLDYQDYKESGCPYLDQSLDHETMKKCNKWIRNNYNSTTTTSNMTNNS